MNEEGGERPMLLIKPPQPEGRPEAQRKKEKQTHKQDTTKNKTTTGDECG
jgi:hypothetical protein